MSMDNGKNPNPNPNYQSEGLMFNSFSNLSLHCNNFTQGNSSNNHNLSFQYNLGQSSLGGSNLSGAPPPSWITQTTTNSGQHLTSSSQSFPKPNIIKKPDLENLRNLLGFMMCPTRYSEFQTFLERIDTYETALKEKILFAIRSILTTNNFTFLDLATNRYGSQFLKALLRRYPSLYGFIYNSVCVNFSVLMNSYFSHYLIVETIRAVDKLKKEKLYELTYINALFLAEQETGCIALNNVFHEVKGRFREGIFSLVALNADRLAFDPCGTHVVQNFVTLKNPVATRAIAEVLYGSFFRLAMERQGSYLVEKCLKSAYGVDIVLDEFRRNDKEWVRMANHRYGNFVVQCALIVMKEKGMKEMLREFVEKLRPHFGEMKYGHGKNALKVIGEQIEGYLLEYNLLAFMA